MAGGGGDVSDVVGVSDVLQQMEREEGTLNGERGTLKEDEWEFGWGGVVSDFLSCVWWGCNVSSRGMGRRC